MRKRFVILACVLFGLFGVLLCSNKTYAAVDGTTIMKKWAFTQYYECVRNNINSPIEQKNSGVVSEKVFPKSGDLWLPSYGFQNSVNSGKVNCYDLFLGKASGLSSGILGYAGINGNVEWSNPSGSQSFLEGLGYVLENNGEQRFTIQANMHTKNEVYAGFYHNVSERDTVGQSVVVTVKDNDEGGKTYSISDGFSNWFNVLKIDFKDHKMGVMVDANWVANLAGCSEMYQNQEAWFTLKTDVQEFYNDVKNGLSNKTWGIYCSTGSEYSLDYSWDTYTFIVDPDGTGIVNSGDAGKFVYAKDQNKYDVSDGVIKTMSGMKIRDLILNNNELYTLYYYYLDKSLPTGVANRITCNPSSTNNLTMVNLKDTDGQVKTCYVNYNGVDPNSISVYTQAHTDLRNRQPYPYIVAITMQDVIDWFNSVDPSTLTDVGGIVDSNDGANNQNGADGDSGELDKCYNGAGVLGWIVCPITSGLSDLGSKAYKWIEENFLQIRTSLIFGDSSSGVYDAWGIVRNIANFGFIIMFLIVIFSQITGVGIDNYGIKRILPKLIVGAILMNLSYIICELAIDVSNIAGSGLKNLLTGMGEPLSSSAVSYSASGGQYAAVFGTGVIAVAIGMILSSGGLGAVLMLFVALLSVVISILVLFIVLIVRQAGVVVCVVVAPVAMMCYLLPNTEKIFKKWLNLMKGLLLVYPLCGLVIGAGDFVGRIFGNLAANSSDALQMGFALSAMIVQAVPYLFIPTLLKSSLAAMGNLGAKISGLGSRIRGGTSKRIQASGAMKNSKERASEFRTRVKAGIGRDGKEKNLTGIGRALRGGKRGMARARAQYLRNQDVRTREDSLMGAGFMAAQVAQEKKAGADEVANEMVLLKSKTNDGANGSEVIEAFNSSMDAADEALARGDKATADKYINKARAAARLAGRRKDTATDFAMGTLLSGKRYNSEALGKVAKEIAEGETAKSYRSGSPLAFEYASQLNQGRAMGADGETPAESYADWLSNSGNIHDALEHHVTTGEELMGVQGKNLRQMAELAKSGAMSSNSVEYLRTLSREAIRTNKENGTQFDFTKAEPIYRLAYGEDEYRSKMVADGIGNLIRANEVRGAEPGSDAARAEETFSVREGQQSAAQRVTSAEPSQSVEAPVRQQPTSGQAIDVRALGDETLLDIATNPNAQNNDATRSAAEQEFLRRNPDFNNGGNKPQSPQAPPSVNPPQQA